MKDETTETMKVAPAIGWAYVLRGLKENDGNTGKALRPPAIGLLVRQLADGRLEVRLRVGPHRWCHRGRIVRATQVSRLATAREVATGDIISDSHLPVAA